NRPSGGFYYLYLSLYNSEDGSGEPAGKREIKFRIISIFDHLNPQLEMPNFESYRIAPPEEGVPNVEFFAYSNVDATVRYFIVSTESPFYTNRSQYPVDFTELADAADPNSGFYPAPEIIYDETGAGKILAEVPAGRYALLYSKRDALGYRTFATNSFIVPEAGSSIGDLESIHPQFAVTQVKNNAIRLIRKGPVFAPNASEEIKAAFQGYRIYISTGFNPIGGGSKVFLGHEVGDAVNPFPADVNSSLIDIPRAADPEETASSPVEIGPGHVVNPPRPDTSYFIYVIAVAERGTGTMQVLRASTGSDDDWSAADGDVYVSDKDANSFTLRVPEIPTGLRYEIVVVDEANAELIESSFLSSVWDVAAPASGFYKHREFGAGAQTDWAITDNDATRTDYRVFIRIWASGRATSFGPYQLKVHLNQETPALSELEDELAYTAVPAPQAIALTREKQIETGTWHYYYLSETPLPSFDPSFVVDGASHHSDFSDATRWQREDAYSGSGSSFSVNFDNLEYETDYHAYVIAREVETNHRGKPIAYQHLQARTLARPPPARPLYDYELDNISDFGSVNIYSTRVSHVPADEIHHLIISATGVPTGSLLNSVGDEVTGLGTDPRLQQSKTLSGGTATGLNSNIVFTGFTPNERYNAYAIAVRGTHRVVQHFSVLAKGPLPPDNPEFAWTASSADGFTLSQGGNVPEHVHYQVIVSRTAIGDIFSKLNSVRDAVTGISDDPTQQQSQTLPPGEARRVVFTGLTPGAQYYVYALAFREYADIRGQTNLRPVAGIPPEVPSYQVSPIREGLQFSASGVVPAGETYHVIVSKTDLGNVANKLTSVRDIVSHSEATERQSRIIDAGGSRSVSFTGLEGGAAYYVYAIVLKGDHQITQVFNPAKYAAGSDDLPNIPSFSKDDTYNVSGAFRVQGTVSEGETYHVLVARKPIDAVGDKVSDDGVTGLGTEQYSKTLADGAASATFTDLVPGLAYHVYVFAFNSSGQVYQYLSVKTGGTFPTVPAASSYRVLAIRGGLQFVQEGNVPADETYYVLVSKTKITDLNTNLASVRDQVRDGNQTQQQVQRIASGMPRRLSFRDLTVGADYYVYSVVAKSIHRVSQDFEPEKYAAGSVFLPYLPALTRDEAGSSGSGSLTLKQKGNVPAEETYYVFVSKTRVANAGSKVLGARVRGLDAAQASQQIASGEARTVKFTDLEPSLNYYVYVISVRGIYRVVQDFRARAGGVPSALRPIKPALAKDSTDTTAGSLTLKQEGKVPVGETYYVILSKVKIANAGPKVLDTVVRGLDTDQPFKKIAPDAARTLIFTDLEPSLNYYVYVIAVKGIYKEVQDFRATSGALASVSAPNYKVSSISAGLRFTQEGKVPAGETYYVVVSQKAISELVSKLRGDGVDGLRNDADGKFAVIDAGKPRTVDFTDLSPSTSYYVYAISVRGEQKVAQVFSPDNYASGDLRSEGSLHVRERERSSSVVYPNPSSGVVYISDGYLGDVLRIYSGFGLYLGEYVLNLPGGGVDLSALKAGLYIVDLKGIRYRVIIK
ncbi:MAG: T9SS type A sorting domain-containing protein, partial [Cytophagales bacterium]|nr:T9SS type A sorting domain-containing protein [Cytophagales bacterium]